MPKRRFSNENIAQKGGFPMSFIGTVRNFGRYREILSVLVRYGFAEIFDDTKISLVFDKIRHHKTDESVKRMARPERLRGAFEELGPTFVKLGQVLSTRPDLLPTEYCEALKRLQDDVTQVPFEEIEKELREEFGDRLDSEFQEINPVAIAAASVGQVHRAVLKDGSKIVLKILRPHIEKTIDADIEILRSLAHVVEDHNPDLGFSPVAVVDNFGRSLKKELDFYNEAKNTDRFTAMFQDTDRVNFAKVYWNVTTRRVLGLQEIEGLELSHWKTADLTTKQRKTIVENVAYAVFKQCLEVGFFHADPHPGNIMVLPGERIVFLDCGMTGHLDPHTARDLADLLYGVAKSDIDRVTQAFMSLGNVDISSVDERAMRQDIQEFVDAYTNVGLEQISLGGMLRQFLDGMRRHHLSTPTDIVMLIKALSTLEGMAEELDPSFDLVATSQPFVTALVKRRYSVAGIKERITEDVRRWANLVETFPTEISKILAKIRGNKMSMALHHEGLEHLTRSIEHASRNILMALIIAGLLVGSSILVHTQRAAESVTGVFILGICGFFVAGFCAVMLLFNNIRAVMRHPKHKN